MQSFPPAVGRFAAGTKWMGAGLLLAGVGYHVASVGDRWMALVGAGFIGALVVGRAVTAAVRRTGVFNQRVLLLGTGPLVWKLQDEIDARPDCRYRVIGVVDDLANVRPPLAITPCVGSINQLQQIIERTRPHRIVIAMADRRGRIPEGPLLACRFRGVTVEDGVDFFEQVTGKLAIEALRPSSLILSAGFRHSDVAGHPLSRVVRHVSAAIVAGVGLVALSPLLALFALAIKLDSPGPVFFIQDRVGCGGRPFGLVKFRTMREAEAPSEWVGDNAARVTRVGRWLRRFRFDELPQLLNVLRGDMNFVGPRPHPVSNYRLFLDRIPYYALREHVRPGITGWAQVRYGYANDLEEETEKMRYDIYYIKHRSIWLDLRIIWETLAVLLFDADSHRVPRHGTPPAETWPDAGRMVRLG
jgi:exopolysaccharide biosynthesis polyprenyl glycosylphosphotransferase